MGECAGYLAEFYRNRERRLKEEKAILKRWKETLEKLHKIDLAMEKEEGAKV